MTTKGKLGALAASVLIAACAGHRTVANKDASNEVAAKKEAPAANARTVKSKDGSFEGEIVGTPQPGSKFAKLQIGMMREEVNQLIGGPNDVQRHETGKRWIPFYYGDDVQRLEALYKGEGCLTYAAGNRWGGAGGELIRITVDPTEACL